MAALEEELVSNVVESVLDEGTVEKEMDMEELEIDDSEFHLGKVSDWRHTWGFLVPLEKEDGEKKQNDRIFVHSSKINWANPEKPFLRKGMQVRYHNAVRAADKDKKVAVDVAAVDGSPINWFEKQGETDPFNRELLGDTVYHGKVTKYFFRRRFGWIEPNEPLNIDGFDKSHIFVAREDINSEGFPPGLKVDEKVEFQVYKDDRGFGACNVSGPEGVKLESPYSHEKDYEGKVFNGTVVKFKVNRFVFIKPDEDLSEFGFFGKDDLHANCEDINTEQRPAKVGENQKITFKLFKDRNGFHAVDICDENGAPINVAEEEKQEEEEEEEKREKVAGEEEEEEEKREKVAGSYEGTVKFYRWDNGVGWIELQSEIPEEIKEKIQHKEGYIYFHRNDLCSLDKVFGIEVDTQIKFNIYTDKKGVGACEITNIDGEPIQGVERPKEIRKPKKGHGHVNYYDRKKRVCHVRYRNKTFKVNDRNCRFSSEVKRLIARGQKVEFMVDLHRGKKVLKNVTLSGRLMKRKRNNRRERSYGGPQMQIDWQQYMLANMMYYQQQHPQSQINPFSSLFLPPNY